MSARPDLGTEEGRLAAIRMLNERLPRKRNIAQGIVRSTSGQVLLCELTYKTAWDLPGGVVDPGESPATCVEREITEELGVQVEARALLAVDWLPPYRGWDDAVLFLFDCGVLPDGALDHGEFASREIRGVHWVEPGEWGGRVADYTTRLLDAAARAEHTAYLEDGHVRETP